MNTSQRSSPGRRRHAPGSIGANGLLAPSGPVRGSYYWGLDPSTVRLSAGVVDTDAGYVAARTHSFSEHPPRSLDRLRAIVRESERFLVELAAEFPPIAVLVEEPAGKTPNPSLLYAVGCILSAVPAVGPGELIPVSSWKLEATGHGYLPGIPPAHKDAMPKEKAARQRERWKAEKARLLLWAQRRGYPGELEDEADAVGIAVACHGRFAPVPEQLALA